MLAAGQARRFGGGKLLAELGGKSLLVRALSVAQEVARGRVCMVTGCAADKITREASSLADLVVDNRDYRDGIGSSIAVGVRACQAQADAIVVMLADQPTIETRHIQALIDTWSGADDEVVLATHAGVQAPPTLFARGCFDQLVELSGDSGARSVVESGRYFVARVAFEDPVIDIDTQEDLQLVRDQVSANRNS